MKKQILFLAMITLAFILAGTTHVNAQVLNPGVTSTTPIIPLSCIATSEPLHPFAGVSYTYGITGDAGEETAANYTWWATKDQGFIPSVGTININQMLLSPTTTTPGTDLVATSADYGTDNRGSSNGNNTVDITWSSSILAGTDYQGQPGPGTPTFVAVYSEGVNCADNIQVYEINPLPNFTIDIAAINPADDATLPWDDNTTAELCVDDVQSAVYNTTTYELDMDYGTNVFYYEVAAQNFVNDWTPTFTLVQGAGTEGLRESQTALLEMFPTLADAQGNTNLIASNVGSEWTSAGGSWATGTALSAANVADIATGVSVFVKVTITNSTYESLTSNPFVLAVDAIDDGGAGIWDMEDEDCGGDPALDAPDQVDFATITVTPRPQLDNNTNDSGAPNPTTVVPKDGGTNYTHY